MSKICTVFCVVLLRMRLFVCFDLLCVFIFLRLQKRECGAGGGGAVLQHKINFSSETFSLDFAATKRAANLQLRKRLVVSELHFDLLRLQMFLPKKKKATGEAVFLHNKLILLLQKCLSFFFSFFFFCSCSAKVKLLLQSAPLQSSANKDLRLQKSALLQRQISAAATRRRWRRSRKMTQPSATADTLHVCEVSVATSFPAALNPARIKSAFRQGGELKIRHSKTYAVLILRQEYVNKANLSHASPRTDPNNWATVLVTMC